MACIVWQFADGKEFLVEQGVAHRPPPGAVNTGRVDWSCGGKGGTQRHEVDAKLDEAGIQWGSAIKWVTQQIGLQQCTSCKARETILNNVKKVGWTETLRQLKDTL